MANKKPVQTEEFKARRFRMRFDEPLGKVRGARLPETADQALQKVSDITQFVREAIIEKLQREGLL